MTIGTSARGRGRTPSDIPTGTWIDRYPPAELRPYLRLARLDRPIGTWLLLWPCWWSATLAAAAEGPAVPVPMIVGLLVLFAIGAVAMRGAGCIYNDIVDRDIDAKVARTATRPLASGAVGLAGGWALLVLMAFIGFLVLIQLDPTAIRIGLVSLLLIAAYPFMKRVTYWPQAWLGLTFNWGALVGWAAATGTLGWPALALYAGGIGWTLGYDTIYAHQDKEDDALVGVKSAALKLGGRTRPAVAGFYLWAVALFALAGALAGAAWPFYLGLAAMALHFGWQVVSLNIDDPTGCLRRFKSNRDAGALFFAGIVLAALLG